jgi:hypothetical protein
MGHAVTLWIGPFLFKCMNHRFILLLGYTLGLGGIFVSQWCTSVLGFMVF